MFESTVILSALSLGFVSVLYVFYGPKQTSNTTRRHRSKVNGINGLYNYGNQCFINAILQSLSSMASMHSWLRYANGLLNERKTSLSYNLLNTINDVNNDSPNSGQSPQYYSAIDVLNALRAHKWTISNEEQDAFELFNVLTTTLESEMHSSLPVYSLRDVLLIEDLINGSPKEIIPSIHSRNIHLRPDVDNRIAKSLPTKGMLCSQVFCRKCCHKYPLHLESFHTISLVLPNNVFGVGFQLSECLNQLVSKEVIQEVKCETCIENTKRLDTNRKSVFVKKLTFAKMPQILCFHIQRLVWLSDGQPMKRCENIAFPQCLDMSPYVYKSQKSQSDVSTAIGLIGGASNAVTVNAMTAPTDSVPNLRECKTNNRFKYRLCSVIVHLGDTSSGHFICYRRGTGVENQTKWFCISDMSVTEVTVNEVLKTSAYILFYERVEHL